MFVGWKNKVLWYSTGAYVQYPVRNHNGKEYLKIRMSKNAHFKAMWPKNKTDRVENYKKRIKILLEFLSVLWDSSFGLGLMIQF